MAGNEDAGVIHQCREPSQLEVDFFEDSDNVGFQGAVALNGNRSAACGANRLHNFVRAIDGFQIVNGDMVSVQPRRMADGGAHSATPTGY